MFTGGFLFAKYTIDDKIMRNEWFNRPDLKPYPAMTPPELRDPEEKRIMETFYHEFRQKKKIEDRKKTSWYRLLWPLSADYKIKENPYVVNNLHPQDVFNPETGFYTTITNRFRDHENK